MSRNRRKQADPPTVLFFEYQQAVLKGEHEKANGYAAQLRQAGFFVRRLPRHAKGGAQ